MLTMRLGGITDEEAAVTEPDNPDLVVGDDGLARPVWAAADPLLRE